MCRRKNKNRKDRNKRLIKARKMWRNTFGRMLTVKLRGFRYTISEDDLDKLRSDNPTVLPQNEHKASDTFCEQFYAWSREGVNTLPVVVKHIVKSEG